MPNRVLRSNLKKLKAKLRGMSLLLTKRNNNFEKLIPFLSKKPLLTTLESYISTIIDSRYWMTNLYERGEEW